jgi:hypothetical protein
VSRTNWKRVEGLAAACYGGSRFAANTGGPLDFETETHVGQVKNVKRLTLKALETLAIEAHDIGFRKGKIGVLVVKRSAGQGIPTPMLEIRILPSPPASE